MVAETEARRPPTAKTASHAARRRLITRALLGNLPEHNDPRRNLFHFEQEMAEQFAKNRLSSYAVVPVLVISMGVAIGVLGNPLMAVAWVVVVLAIHAYAMSASRHFLREGLSNASLYVWKRRFVHRDLAYGLAWAVFPVLIPPSAERRRWEAASP